MSDLDNEELEATRSSEINSIEEAIKRCKELIKPVHINWIGGMNQNAIKILIGNLEALSDMQDSANREIKELRKKVKELEKEVEKYKKSLIKRIKYCNELEKDLFENCENYVVNKKTIKK